jgi:septal ring factor EnvC (AmiA/AmiB activator)
MARTRTIASIETEISKVKQELSKTQEKYNKLSEVLSRLKKQQYEYEVNEIMNAYAKSGKSYRELMIFLDT